jgi:superfamily II DNA or RNA helicase
MLKKEFTLRPYQDAFITKLGHAVKRFRRVIACAATGSGKSKTFLRISVNAIKKGYTVLVITESRKIYNQLIAEVHAIEINSESKLHSIQAGNIYLAMAQTLKRRQYLIEQFKSPALEPKLLIINDECHINQATGILLQLEKAMLIGFSGSPVGKHLIKLYKNLVVGPQPHELVLDGFLTPYRHFERKRADISQLELDRSGEYTEESQEQVFMTDAVYDGIVEDLKNFEYKKALIFTSSIKHCDETAERLTAAGFRCVTVHSGKTCNEKYNLFQFENGLIPICVSVGILTKGFDLPAIDFIGILRKTSSLALYLQMIGRASRVLEHEVNLPIEQRTKKQFLVFDYGLNVTKHWPWDFERDWETIWCKPAKRDGVSPIKICPQCDYVNNASAKICVNCGYTWHSLNVIEPPETHETILVEITGKYNKLVGKHISELIPEELAIYAKSKGKKGFALVVAKKHAIDGDEEFIKQYAKAMNYKPQWVYFQMKALSEMSREDQIKKYTYKDDQLK